MQDRSTALEPLEEPARVTAHGWGGHEVEADSEAAIAKVTQDRHGGKPQYWLLRATSGPERGTLFNPQSPMYVKAAHGRSKYAFRKATQAEFEAYLRFIQSPHNPTHLRHAERAS